eukprot:scaffold285_cov304-Pinguiococcus_pyrenoidosus.AAC.25
MRGLFAVRTSRIHGVELFRAAHGAGEGQDGAIRSQQGREALPIEGNSARLRLAEQVEAPEISLSCEGQEVASDGG